MAKFKVKKTTQKKPRKSKSEGKYAHKKTTIDGITFDSKMEASYYEYLKELKATGQVTKIELQPVYELLPKHFIFDGETVKVTDKDWSEKDKLRRQYNKISAKEHQIKIIQPMKYISDFRVTYFSGHVKVIDVKGIKTTDFKLKEKLYNYLYPNNPLLCVTWDGPSKEWLTYEEYNIAKKERKKKK